MTQNLLYTNNNPRPETICAGCLALIGHVFTPGTEPPLPAHPNCWCAYYPTDQEPTGWTADGLDGHARRVWILRVVLLILAGLSVPITLHCLIDEAEEEIESREEEPIEDPGPGAPEPHPSPPEEDHMSELPAGTKALSHQPAINRPMLLSPLDRSTFHGHRVYRCLFIGAGRVRQMDGDESTWLIPVEPLRASVPLFAGAASYVDHPDMFGFGWRQEPSLRDLAGVCLDPEWDDVEQGVAGILQLYDDDPAGSGAMIGALYDQILADRIAGRSVPEIGLSAVLWHSSHLDETSGLTVTDHIADVDSVDHVYSAGARGYVRQALARVGWDNTSHISIPTPGAQAPSQIPRSPAGQGGSTMSEELHDMGQPTNATAAPLADPPTGGAAPPAPAEDHTPAILDSLARISDRLQRLETVTAQAAEPSTVEGMGIPPRAVAYGMKTGFEELEQAAEALLSGVRPPSGVRPLTGIRELYTLLSGDFELTGIYQPDRIYLANVTSSTMAQLVANVLNKRVMIAFQTYPRWWEPIVSIENFTSLQQVRWITLGGVGELPTVAEGAAYTELTWNDIAQRDTFVKKGGYLGLTLEAIDKDDTRQVQSAPRALAQAAWMTLSKSISAIFTVTSGTGPSIYYDDSNTRVLFHASNSNLGTTALSAASWESTRQAMRDQTEHNSGEPLGALTAPKYLLVPNELEFTALQILATEHMPGSANYNINPEAAGDGRTARLAAARDRVIVMDLWTDANNWAAVADPQLYPSIGLAFRFGSTPEIFSVADPRAGLMFSNDVMPVKVRFFYATGPVDWRGLYKHNVS